jgi:hypothetical protein
MNPAASSTSLINDISCMKNIIYMGQKRRKKTA